MSISEFEKALWQRTDIIQVEYKLSATGYMDKLQTVQLKGSEAMASFLNHYTDGSKFLSGIVNTLADLTLKGESVERYTEDKWLGEERKKILLNLSLLEQAMSRTDLTLYRYETRPVKVGDRLIWGLRSTSADASWVEMVAKRGYLTEGDLEKWGKRTETPVIYEIKGAKALNITAFSEFPEQQEWLVRGIFRACEVIDDGDIIRVKLEAER